MTIERAIEILDPDCATGHIGSVEIEEALKMGATALRKQEPKLVHVTAELCHRKIGECPSCGKLLDSDDYPNYCAKCGQAVKWE